MSNRREFVKLAKQQVGKPYKWGTAGPRTFDCSGLVAWCYGAIGAGMIPRDSHMQFNSGVHVELKDARPGDLLFYDTMSGLEQRAGNTASHVGIYLGEDEAVHALNEADDVKITRVDTEYWTSRFLGARDIFGTDKDDAGAVVTTSPPALFASASGTSLATTIGPTTPFRSIGDVPLVTWRQVLSDANSPLARLDACYDACKGYTALALAQMERESSYGKDDSARAKKNPLGLMLPDGSTLQSFISWDDALAEWRWRITDPSYKGKPGPYYPKAAPGFVPGYDLSLLGYLITYVGGPQCLETKGATCANGETYSESRGVTGLQPPPASPSINYYAQEVIRDLNAWLSPSTGTTTTTRPPSTTTTRSPSPPSSTTTTPEPSGGIVFGRVPRPVIINRIIPGDEAQNGVWVPVGQNSAWNDLGRRQFRGVCLHIMEGTLDGTDAFFRNEARQSALTDFGIGRGTKGGRDDYWIYQWNTFASRRAPWANGKTDGLEGDGPAFVDAYDVNAVNRDLRSIEHAGFVNQVLNERIIDLSVELMAYLADQERIRWDQWPYGPDGLILTYAHYEFARKSCPGQWFIDQIGRMNEAVGERLRRYQAV